MFADLIFILFATFVLSLIDNFSTILGLIFCAVLSCCCVYNSFIVLNKQYIVIVAKKLWTTLAYCFCLKRQALSLYKRIFLTGKDVVTNKTAFCSDFCGSLENEIDTLVLNISQHYIESWYGKISSNKEFSQSLNSSIKHTLFSLCLAVAKVDKKKVSYIVMQIYLHFFSHFLEEKKKQEAFNKDNFKIKHWAMKDKATEWCYLQSLVSLLLDFFCPSDSEKSLSSKSNHLLHTIVVEILTQNVIQPLVKILSDPVCLNLLILKVVENVSKTNEDVTNSTESIPEKEQISSNDSIVVQISPTVLLPIEDSSDDSVFIKESAGCLLDLQSDSNQQAHYNQKSDIFVTKDPKKTLTNVLTPVSTSLKSISNANLFDRKQFSTMRRKHCYKEVIDVTIKRSKSADYIHQIPQFKALNDKDYNIVIQSETHKIFIALKKNKNSCIEQAEEAIEIEVPSLFTDLQITETFQENENGVSFTRYCIQYKGLFHDNSPPSEALHLIQQVVSVKRRFKEFVALQSSLEENLYLRTYLKEIKAPSKWLLPFSNLDKKHIAERKVFLESYLTKLCSLPLVALSAELHEFLAYGEHESLYTRRYPENFVPRIDKMLVRGVKGAYDILKTAFPNSPNEDDNIQAVFLKSNGDDLSTINNFKEFLLDYSSREPEIKENILNFISTSFLKSSFCDLSCEESNSKRTMLRTLQSLEASECCNCHYLSDKDFHHEKSPFGNTACEFLTLCLELQESNIGELFPIIKLLFVSFIDEFIVNKLDKSTEKILCNLIHMLHKYLWPGIDKSLVKPPECSEAFSLLMQCIKSIVSVSFPFKNSQGLQEAILHRFHLLLTSLQHQEINKCLLFYIFDAVIEALCLPN